jgi:hypothetical protein
MRHLFRRSCGLWFRYCCSFLHVTSSWPSSATSKNHLSVLVSPPASSRSTTWSWSPIDATCSALPKEPPWTPPRGEQSLDDPVVAFRRCCLRRVAVDAPFHTGEYEQSRASSPTTLRLLRCREGWCCHLLELPQTQL